MGWLACIAAWMAAAVFWALASAASGGMSPLETLPYGALAMGFAGVMGVGVWRLTARVAWDWRRAGFYATHAAALAVYAVVYATAWWWPEIAMGRVADPVEAFRTSPVTMWNLLMGSWLYLVVAGLSYAIRAQREARSQEAAAAEARLLAQQAQLAALRAQINPHFLFNALHSVGALVSSEPARADEALERLGDLLRYALGAGDEVLFAHEWKFTHDYLAFEHLRLGDRLRVDTTLDDAALAIPVPPLILQPLVENAVRHGIADRPEGGEIRVVARVSGGALTVRVEDDGRGVTKGAGAGLGLTSVRRRLAQLYGDRATVTVDDRRSGFCVTLHVPLAPAGTLGSAA
jgi:signal transduction histidine kinase